MRFREFMGRLPTGGWHMRHNGAIRRGSPTEKLNSECQCPITSLSGRPACAYRITEKIYGLDGVLAERIAEAADNECHTPTIKRIRRALLDRLFPASTEPAV